MIIFEGPDNGGKTTLIRQVCPPIGIPVVQGMGKPHSVEAAHMWVHSALRAAQTSSALAFDRFPLISESIYGPILRNVDTFATDAGTELWQLMKLIRPLVIYCRPSDETILNWGERDQMEGVKEAGQLIIDGYDRFIQAMEKEHFNIVWYNWKKDSPTIVLEAIDLYLKNRFLYYCRPYPVDKRRMSR